MGNKPNRLGRLVRFGKLTGRVASSYLGDTLRGAFASDAEREGQRRQVHIDNAKQVAHTLGKMRGAAQKLGQTIAMAATSLDLPPEVGAVLSKLNNGGARVPFAEIKAVVEQEIEGPLASVFSHFSEEPVGTASLAQAHAAVLLDGTAVVVKVLHEGVREGVQADLLALRTVLLGGAVFRRGRDEMDTVFREIQERLIEELDYYQEALNITDFWSLYAEDERVTVPRVYSPLCTDRILTMDRLKGMPLDQFLKTASKEARQRAGHTLAQLYYEQVCEHRLLHADPHPGNYLFEEDGRVSVFDFGCVKRFDEFWMGTYARTTLCAFDGDRGGFLEGCVALDIWVGDDQAAADVLWEFAEQVTAPFKLPEYTIGGHEHSILVRLKPVMGQLMFFSEIRVPADLIFLHRSLAGMYSLARRLEVSGDWGALMVPHMRSAVRRAFGDPS